MSSIENKKEKTGDDFWKDKLPCWKMTNCPEAIYTTCPVYHNREYPCWEVEGTYCKWNDWASNGKDTSICLICKVFQEYSESGSDGEIRLKLMGKGIELIK